MRGPPVVLTNTLGRPVTNIISERGAVPMVVVNTLGEPVTLVSSGGEPVTLFNANGTLWDYPFSLFANNEQGAWYDPSDFSTLYQTSTGTTPVTAVEQPVGLMLDRSRGLVLGAELYTGGTINCVAIGGPAFTDYPLVPGATMGRWYRITFTLSGYSGSSAIGVSGNLARYEPDLLPGGLSANGVFDNIAFLSTSGGISLFSQSTNTGVLSNISVRELAGNHAFQATSASRPVLRARYNQLTYSEQFDNAAWTKTGTTVSANAATAPDGTTTADKWQETAGGSGHVINQSVSVITGAQYTFSVYAKAGENIYVGLFGLKNSVGKFFNLSTGAVGNNIGSAPASATIESVGNGWYRCSITDAETATTSRNFEIYSSKNGTNWDYSGTLNDGILIWGAQIQTAADQTSTGGAYQRIAAATDYDVSNPVWRPYLAFDGTDDSMATSSIDFSATDEMTVFAGVTKLSDAATACVMSYNGTSNASAEMFAPRTTGANGDFAFSHRTTTVQEAGGAIPVLSPATAVLTGISDISAPFLELRRNGAVIQTNTTALAANNYTSGTIRIGHRSSNLYLNGRLYSLAVLGRTTTAAELSAMEAWVAGKTGVTL